MAESYLAEVKCDATAINAGTYASQSGTEGIEIVFDLDVPLPNGAKTIVGTLWLSEKALERTRKTLTAVGVNWGDVTMAGDEALCSAIAGKKFKLVCALEAPNTYHKTEKWIVRFINGPKQATQGALAALRGEAPAPVGDDTPF